MSLCWPLLAALPPFHRHKFLKKLPRILQSPPPPLDSTLLFPLHPGVPRHLVPSLGYETPCTRGCCGPGSSRALSGPCLLNERVLIRGCALTVSSFRYSPGISEPQGPLPGTLVLRDSGPRDSALRRAGAEECACTEDLDERGHAHVGPGPLGEEIRAEGKEGGTRSRGRTIFPPLAAPGLKALRPVLLGREGTGQRWNTLVLT